MRYRRLLPVPLLLLPILPIKLLVDALQRPHLMQLSEELRQVVGVDRLADDRQVRLPRRDAFVLAANDGRLAYGEGAVAVFPVEQRPAERDKFFL